MMIRSLVVSEITNRLVKPSLASVKLVAFELVPAGTESTIADCLSGAADTLNTANISRGQHTHTALSDEKLANV